MKRNSRSSSEAQHKSSPASRSPVLVLGVGNILLSDEGVGVRAVEAMAGLKLPDNVELLDGGTASINFLDTFANRDKVIIIDAVKGGNQPGTLYRFNPDNITVTKQQFISLHQVGLLETLTIARYLGYAPREVVIFGIEPHKVSPGLELSPEVTRVVPRVIELVLSEL